MRAHLTCCSASRQKRLGWLGETLNPTYKTHGLLPDQRIIFCNFRGAFPEDIYTTLI